MDYFIQLLVSGIAAGLVYGFIGMGFAMIYRATGVVNFAQGELMMLVAYIAFTLAGTFKLGFWPLLLATVVVSVALGLLVGLFGASILNFVRFKVFLKPFQVSYSLLGCPTRAAG